MWLIRVIRQPISATVPSIFSVRRTNPVSDTEGAIEIEHNTGEKIAQDIFARHTNSDTADTAKGQQTGQTHAKMFAIQ
ncbi:Uncharacterised protein [Salmonella enterica subsp. enterica]|nr:Uncharacterised protein [Salmonella enterica subsp. enterica] [Salmonella enterica subsp. enterica serovar Menston]